MQVYCKCKFPKSAHLEPSSLKTMIRTKTQRIKLTNVSQQFNAHSLRQNQSDFNSFIFSKNKFKYLAFLVIIF